jgi:Protein of unknown function (DUF3078).
MKKAKLLLLVTIFGFINTLSAQEKGTVDKLAAYAVKDTLTGWKTSGLVGLAFGQTSLTNWTAGGDNTITGDLTVNLTANFLNDKWFWDNNLMGEFGLVSSSANDYWQKAADQLNLTSIVGRSLTNRWAFSALLNFKTQFTKGYNYPDTDHYISTFMAPAYGDLALGFTYKPSPKYTFFLSPLAERATFVLNDSLSNIGAFGIDPGKKVKWETGAYLMASTNQALATNLSLISSLDMFTPYNTDFGKVNINWNLLLNYKFNKLFTATLNTTLRYYDAEIGKVQFKEILGLGLTYTF